MLFLGRVTGVVLLLSIACRGDDILDRLEKQYDTAFPPKSSSSSSSSSTSPSSSLNSSASILRAPELTAPSLVGGPIASNLAKLISDAIKIQSKPLGDAKKEGLASPVTEKDENAAEVVDEPVHDVIVKSSNDSVNTTLRDASTISSAASEKGDDANSGTTVEFTPASSEQFGELGPGSKVMQYLPDFSQLSIEANGLAGVAGAGAVALMALGAIFAVPVAPVILRRTGNKGWAGLPSWRDLFSWWNSPDPVAEAWADKNQFQQQYEHDYPEGAYYHNGQAQYYAYDTSGSSSDHQNSYYTDTNQIRYVIPAPVDSSETVDYDSEQNFQASVSYPDQHRRHIQQQHQQQQQQHQQQQQQYHQQQQQIQQQQLEQKQQQVEEEEEDVVAYEPQAFHDFRRIQKPEKIDGHELVTLEQLNRIGEESVKLLGELAKGYSPDDLYAYRDGNNQLRRRNLNTRHEGRLPQSNQRLQYQPEPSYQESSQTFSETYLKEEDASNAPSNHQGHQQSSEGFQNKKVFSLTQPSSDEYIEEEEQVVTSYEAEPHYKHSYSFTNPGIVSTSAYHQEDKNTEQTVHKVSEFPYQFHKEQ